MYCQHCGKKLIVNTKYCGNCGKNTPETFFVSVQPEEVKINQGVCESCAGYGELKYVVLYENIGAIFVRYHREIQGNLCKDCINRYFWRFTLTTLLVGWLGIISFVVAPFYIINNVFRYLRTKIN